MATVGPVAIAVDANTNAFRVSVTQCIGYASETFSAVTTVVTLTVDCFHSICIVLFDSSSCSNTILNHAMLVTGYGSYNGKDYWLVKNR